MNTDFIYTDEDVEMEDVTADEYPDLYQHKNVDQGAPAFHEEVMKEAEDCLEVKSKVKGFYTGEPFDPTVDEINSWFRFKAAGKIIKAHQIVDQERKDTAEAWIKENQVTTFKTVSKVHGNIVSWLYDSDLKVCIIKWGKGVGYYEKIRDVLTLPRWDVRTLARRPFINHGGHQHADMIYQHLLFEVNHGFKFFKPQVPRRKRIDEIDPRTGWRKPVLKVKPPKTMKQVPVKTMPQDMYISFNRWYYDNRTSEAVIILWRGLKTKLIKVIDSMWLVNLSETDNDVLFRKQILFERQEDYDLAKKFQRVVRVCHEHGIHSYRDWQSKRFK
ncbi:uncharacterized protein LOC143604242 isoform X1 [Bidens hawaiensis]|uniref:uncharacterized protein LOC143604242 isoform X1 n=1 Tax=Bidens hawaiensis TaxID=980011 RepID=UPI00404A5D04